MFKRVAVFLVLAAVGGAAFWYWHGQRNGDNADRLLLYGNVDIHESEVAFKVSGRIARLLVREGDRVAVGDALAELEGERFSETVARAEARVAAQREQLAALEAGSRPEEIRRAQAEAEAAHASAESARSTFVRTRELVERKLAPQEQLDTVRAAAEAAQARLRAARETLDLAMAGPRQEDIAAARASLRALEAELALARIEQGDAALRAPVDGVVRNRILEPGESASPQTPVVTLALDNPVWVRAWLPEPELGRVRPGMAAFVTTDSYPGKRYQGWVGYLSPTAEFTPKMVHTEEVRTQLVYQVRIEVCNPEGELRLGMPAAVTLPLDQPAPTAAHRCGDE